MKIVVGEMVIQWYEWSNKWAGGIIIEPYIYIYIYTCFSILVSDRKLGNVKDSEVSIGHM